MIEKKNLHANMECNLQGCMKMYCALLLNNLLVANGKITGIARFHVILFSFLVFTQFPSNFVTLTHAFYVSQDE
jgi:hypothetical protein